MTTTPAQLRQALEAAFPPSATCWSQATDEVLDMSRAARTNLDLDESHAVDFRSLKTPSEWNTQGIDSIIGFYEQMDDPHRAAYIALLKGLFPDLLTPTDAEIIDWLQRNHTLHRAVEATYVVDGYSVEITHDGFQIPGKSWHGETLREAYSKAMAEWDVTHGNTDLLASKAGAA